MLTADEEAVFLRLWHSDPDFRAEMQALGCRVFYGEGASSDEYRLAPLSECSEPINPPEL